ncbi:MAG TPA: RNA polymerase sigma factor [Sphingobacteriaceae bacterium]|nr:RNA polymerase sigma factor [Sphingobacteriaceae bacterium]
MTAASLVPDLKAGVPGAWERLFHHWYPTAYRTALHITQDAGRAEDAIQEALCHAFRRIGTLRSADRLEAWLRVIVSRAAVDQMRSRARHREVVMDDRILALAAAPGDLWPGSLGAATLPEEAALARVEATTVRNALAAMPAHFRQVLILYYYHQLTVTEIAQTLGCAAGTVKSRLNRARTHLRQQLAPALAGRPGHPGRGPEATAVGGGNDL